MNQRDAVIEAMKANGGYATLGFLYREALRIPDVKWGTKTPFKSINRIVQDSHYFFRVRPGLWALNEAKNKLPEDVGTRRKPESDHTYYQGLLVELGNLRKQATFVPKQDRGKTFLGKHLGEIATLDDIYPFTYDEIVRRARTVDVIWFNEKKMPTEFIEIENTTDINGALLKFTNFMPFFAVFRIVAPSARKREFESKIGQPIFKDIGLRTKFSSYELVSDLHSRASEIAVMEERWLAK